MDAIHEGITLACAGVRAAEREDGLRRADAIRACMDGFDAWVFAPYGEDAGAVRDAAWSQLVAMFVEAEHARHAREGAVLG